MHGMRFTVQRDAFAEAVAWAARALPTRPVIPVLAGLLLQAVGDRLTLACFDYEVSARVTVAADVGEPGTVLVPGRLLLEITRSLPALPVEFADDPDGVSMTCGEASFTLVTLPPDEYPELPDLPQFAGSVDGGQFAAAIGQVTPAASKDDTLPLLTAVNLELDGARMTLAATDRYRLAVRDIDWEPAGALEHASVLVPARVLADAARMMGTGTLVRILLRDGSDAREGGAARATDGAMIGFEVGERRLTTRLLAGEFPKYRSRFPVDFGCAADVPAGAFAEAVRRVSLVAERGTPVQLSFGAGRVTIAAATAGQARARESVPAEFTGDEPVIAFSPHYLLDGVVAAAGGGDDDGDEAGMARVRLQFTSPSKPAVITPAPVTSPPGDGEPGAQDNGDAAVEAGSGFRYLVVPKRAAQ
jgi:DNA polymerase-3 subunit beta